MSILETGVLHMQIRNDVEKPKKKKTPKSNIDLRYR